MKVCEDLPWLVWLFNHDEVKVSHADGVGRITEKMVSDALEDNLLRFIEVSYNGERIGGWLVEFGESIAEVHTAILPQWRGKIAVDAAKAFARWMFETYQSLQSIQSQVPKPFREAAFFAKMAGMKRIGDGDDFTYNGETSPMRRYELGRISCL